MFTAREIALARVKGLLMFESTLSKEEAKKYRETQFIDDIKEILKEEGV